MKIQICEDYFATYFFENPSENPFDFFVEVPDQKVAEWENIIKAYDDLQKELQELHTKQFPPIISPDAEVKS